MLQEIFILKNAVLLNFLLIEECKKIITVLQKY